MSPPTHKLGWYIQAMYHFERFSIGYRLDRYHPGGTSDPEQDVNSLILNHSFGLNVIGKLEIHQFDARSGADDYLASIFSIVAYLGE